MDTRQKEVYAALLDALAGHGRVAVAFSGGVDSALLLHAAREALGSEAFAITAASAFFPERESEGARAFCERAGIAHVVVRFDCLGAEGVAANASDRCYRCKRALMGLLQGEAQARGAQLVEGSNASDAQVRRPGAAALAELGIASPLADAGLTKADVRAVARAAGIAVWDKPSLACLATRFPYGERITEERLRAVDAAEQALLAEGFTQVRVRAHGEVARIELLPDEMGSLLEGGRGERIYRALRQLGFSYTAADLRGYRTGSADEVLEERI